MGLRPAVEAGRVVAGVRRVAGGDPARPRALHRGLTLPFPALVLSSAASTTPTVMGEDVHSTDIVLDVEQIRRWSTALGRHVTYVGVEGARHDVFLSREEPRTRAFAELARWLTAYVEGGDALLR